MVIQSLRSICIFIKLGLVVNDKHTKNIKHKVIWIKTRLSLIFKGVQQINILIGYIRFISVSITKKLTSHVHKNRQHKKEKKTESFVAVDVAPEFLFNWFCFCAYIR